jgi:CRP-like cAMP-binding protein
LSDNSFSTSKALEKYLDKIEARRPISQAARDAFLALPAYYEEYEIYRQIIEEDTRTRTCCLVVSGCVSRFKTLPNGERQINSFHFDGDMVDLQSTLLLVSDHGIRTHSHTATLRIDCNAVLGLSMTYPELAHAFWYDTLVDASIFREWMLNVGRRAAVGRVAHLLLEIAHKLQRIGRCDGSRFVMPITQNDLADAVGLSAVHTNRSLQQLRQDGIISSIGRTFVIENIESMKRIASFDPSYLHPEGPREYSPTHSNLEREGSRVQG